MHIIAIWMMMMLLVYFAAQRTKICTFPDALIYVSKVSPLI